eukprot:Protomagalhaensia_wolfi_Nauph_80__4655@NODE_481_length_2451_cov_471_868574_g361_i0_p2_GENE_NODE_481_length_2451_cov_471_868574_g361_i0NODE_481_length_2451_cov_471_868574_g361_i0_p2_ORF_typecomplete_len209_score41_69NuA4/PF09340_10/2_3e05UPF0258/PF06789_12/0_18_NODE_481_length_2451_cov_471_868574_g361_i012411867
MILNAASCGKDLLLKLLAIMTVLDRPSAPDTPASRKKQQIKLGTTTSSAAEQPVQEIIKPHETTSSEIKKNPVLEDMKFASLDLRRHLRSIEKGIIELEGSYIQQSSHIDNQLCNLLNGFSNQICLKSIANDTGLLDGEAKAEALSSKRRALLRALLAGLVPGGPLPPLTPDLEHFPFSLTSLSSPITSQLLFSETSPEPQIDSESKA